MPRKNGTQVVDSGKERGPYDDVVDEYINNCKRFELKVDPSVVIALATG
jgi:hypothetical protein